ncbi:unnamed protein product [Ixodes pacificus]
MFGSTLLQIFYDGSSFSLISCLAFITWKQQPGTRTRSNNILQVLKHRGERCLKAGCGHVSSKFSTLLVNVVLKRHYAISKMGTMSSYSKTCWAVQE